MTLKDFKDRNNLSYRDLSEKTKVPIATLHRICEGRRPSVGTLTKLHESTRIPLHDLLGRHGK